MEVASSKSLMVIMARLSFSSSIGFAIWTAGLDVFSDFSVNSKEAKVTPCIPSLPVLPPARTMKSPAFAFLIYFLTGRIPTHPQ